MKWLVEIANTSELRCQRGRNAIPGSCMVSVGVSSPLRASCERMTSLISSPLDADEAMFREVLELLVDCSSVEEERQERAPRYPIGSVARRKRAIDKLRLEAKDLSHQLDLLRGRFRLHPFASAREEALKQKRKREEAERENEALRRDLAAHTAFLKGLTVVYGKGPCLAVIHRRGPENTRTRLQREDRKLESLLLKALLVLSWVETAQAAYSHLVWMVTKNDIVMDRVLSSRSCDGYRFGAHLSTAGVCSLIAV